LYAFAATLPTVLIEISLGARDGMGSTPESRAWAFDWSATSAPEILALCVG